MEQPAEDDPVVGLTIGNYEVKQKLGEGGMGAVYLAEHPLIGKKVALKVLHSELSTNRDVIARFFTEAKAVTDIQHPNIVEIIDYGEMDLEDGSSMVYFIMEFLSGESLAQLLRREKPLPADRARAIAIQIADALQASHMSGVVHRDLKPDNIILTQRGRQQDFVKVLDFGIAKLTGDRPGGSTRTRTGIVMGTPAYMSPEQCEGRGNVDHRTDIYALGILLYEMMTGLVPFSGEGYGEVLVQHMTRLPMRPSTFTTGLSPHLEAICLKALEKRADARFPNMGEFMKALADPAGYVQGNGGLKTFIQTPLPQHTPYPLPTTPSHSGGIMVPTLPGTKTRNRYGLLIGLGIVLIAGISGMLWAMRPDKRRVTSAPFPDARQTVTTPVDASGGPPDAAPPDAASEPDAPILRPVSKVTIKIEEPSPSGVSISVKGQTVCITTPCEFQLPKSSKPVKLVFRKRRYKPSSKLITPDSSKRVGGGIRLKKDIRCTAWGAFSIDMKERKRVQNCKKCTWPSQLGKGSCGKRVRPI